MSTLESSECSLSSLEVGAGRRDREHLLKGFSVLWKHVFDSRSLGNVSISRWPRNAFKGALCRIHLYWPNPISRLSGSMSQYWLGHDLFVPNPFQLICRPTIRRCTRIVRLPPPAPRYTPARVNVWNQFADNSIISWIKKRLVTSRNKGPFWELSCGYTSRRVGGVHNSNVSIDQYALHSTADFIIFFFSNLCYISCFWLNRMSW
jgi:hypothetical protein